jgi:hypothetical protein
MMPHAHNQKCRFVPGRQQAMGWSHASLCLEKVYWKLRKSWGNVEKVWGKLGGTSGREPVVMNWLGGGLRRRGGVDSRGDLVSWLCGFDTTKSCRRGFPRQEPVLLALPLMSHTAQYLNEVQGASRPRGAAHGAAQGVASWTGHRLWRGRHRSGPFLLPFTLCPPPLRVAYWIVSFFSLSFSFLIYFYLRFSKARKNHPQKNWLAPSLKEKIKGKMDEKAEYYRVCLFVMIYFYISWASEHPICLGESFQQCCNFLNYFGHSILYVILREK